MKFKVGDLVQYKDHKGMSQWTNIPCLVGIVIETRNYTRDGGIGFCKIHWLNNDHYDNWAAESNLKKVEK